jgi:RNA polymerase sigma-70 factor (sigma-E family)
LSVADRGVGGPAAAAGAHRADAAIAELYAGHWSGLVRLAWLLLRDDQLAEEVTQDAFIAVHANWASLRDHGSAVAYLRRSVVNKARSSLRHRGVEERYLDRQRGDRGAWGPAQPGPEEHALAHESHDAMIRALGRLSQRQREVLTMRYYLDLSEAEIADALGVSAGSVKAHAHRGLAALRDEMRDGTEVGR